MRINGVDSKALYYPELKLINIILAFLKTMFFVRIYEDYGMLVQMLQSCLFAVVPFAVYFIVCLLVFSVMFVILEMEIDPEVNEAEGLNYFAKTVLQTFRTAIGELGTPVYTKLLEKEDSIFKSINILLIWVCWLCQTFLMLIVMLNFLIAVITDNYNSVAKKQLIYGYLHKAQLNHETYMLLSVI